MGKQVQSDGVGLASFGHLDGDVADLAPIGVVEGKVLHEFLEDGLVKLGLGALEALQVGLPLVVLLLQGEAGDRVQEFLEGGQRQVLGRHLANYYKSQAAIQP